MEAWIDIRRKARACHEKALRKAGGDRCAAAIVGAALANDDLELRRLDFGPGILGSLDRSARLVKVAENQKTEDEVVVIAHEIGHFRLHRDPHNEVTVRPHGLGGDSVDSGAGRVEGYSPRERKEVQADIFAGELLCPTHWLREEFLVSGKRPNEIAEELGLPRSLVVNQLVRALLLPPLRPVPAARPIVVHELDESQKIAAHWDKGPLLVDAGPGTGKTRTLVERVRHLLSKGARPSSILALTFSNKAAEEMRERLASVDADSAIEMWVGTFHAFGLELIRKWPLSIGRTSEVRVIDQTGSLALLEANLEKLPLHYFQNLYEPAYELVNLLRAISRCKDELITPEQYAEAARAAASAARNEAEREDAAKLQEIAVVYSVYEKLLEEADLVDFGDLVRLAVELVKSNKDVQDYLSALNHVLVDEFQDVNAASASFLRAICDRGIDVWVVADQRQSIYRFRGAEPLNVASFVATFGGSKHALGTNYRSVGPVVRTLEAFSSAMAGGRTSGRWHTHRGNGGGVSLTETPDLAAEGEFMASQIKSLRQKGVNYSDQVILARSHLVLARITGVLESLGIPLLYLGDLFERPEIRDLLSLIAVDAEFGGIGLVRVADLPEYGVPRADCLTVIRWANDRHIPLLEALTRCNEIEGVTEGARSGLSKLGSQLEGLAHATPLKMLTTWLFERSRYLDPLLRANDSISQQRLVAIYHLLKVCGEFAADGHRSRKRFLERIRRIELLNEDTPFRAVSSEASDMDAVRVMTIHGSKGLEFGAVHFPALATGYMPSNRKGTRFPTPPSLPELAVREEHHHAEEECLFFVGLSRAKDYLSLSRAEKYTTRKAGASKYLNSIAGISAAQYLGSGRSYSEASASRLPEIRDSYAERDLDLYMKCPARYRYTAIEGLRGGPAQSAYLRFHSCVYMTVGWLEEERQNGKTATVADALQRLDATWATNGPVGYGLENYYRAAADKMVTGMADIISRETGHYDRQAWTMPVAQREITLTPDRVIIGDDGTVHVQRVLTGRVTISEPDKPIYALLRRGAMQRYPGRQISIEILYLGARECVVVPAGNEDKLIAEYSDAVGAIERGEFHPKPDARRCPNCQCYFVCGA